MNILKKILGFTVYRMLDPFMRIYANFRVHHEVEDIHFSVRNYHINSPVNISGQKNIYIGANFSAGSNFKLKAIEYYAGDSFSPSIVIGDNVTIQDNCHIGCVNKVEIGEGTLIGSRVLIIDHQHGNINVSDLATIPVMRKLSHLPVHIGKNVWVGEGVCILPGVTLGDGVIVGANSVVTHSFESNVVIAGVPAKVIKHLD